MAAHATRVIGHRSPVRPQPVEQYVAVQPPDARDEPASDHYVERAKYDLAADPYELDNLIDSQGHQEITNDLRDLLTRKISHIEGRPVSITLYPDVRDRGRFAETMVRRLKLDGRRLA